MNKKTILIILAAIVFAGIVGSIWFLVSVKNNTNVNNNSSETSTTSPDLGTGLQQMMNRKSDIKPISDQEAQKRLDQLNASSKAAEELNKAK